jgi:uncharacterized membrane protein YfbV (UPF0208 family)
MCTTFWLEDVKRRELGRPTHKWEYNIRMDLKEIGWEIHLVQDKDKWRTLVNTVMSLRVPLRAVNFLIS